MNRGLPPPLLATPSSTYLPHPNCNDHTTSLCKCHIGRKHSVFLYLAQFHCCSGLDVSQAPRPRRHSPMGAFCVGRSDKPIRLGEPAAGRCHATPLGSRKARPRLSGPVNGLASCVSTCCYHHAITSYCLTVTVTLLFSLVPVLLVPLHLIYNTTPQNPITTQVTRRHASRLRCSVVWQPRLL